MVGFWWTVDKKLLWSGFKCISKMGSVSCGDISASLTDGEGVLIGARFGTAMAELALSYDEYCLKRQSKMDSTHRTRPKRVGSDIDGIKCTRVVDDVIFASRNYCVNCCYEHLSGQYSVPFDLAESNKDSPNETVVWTDLCVGFDSAGKLIAPHKACANGVIFVGYPICAIRKTLYPARLSLNGSVRSGAEIALTLLLEFELFVLSASTSQCQSALWFEAFHHNMPGRGNGRGGQNGGGQFNRNGQNGVGQFRNGNGYQGNQFGNRSFMNLDYGFDGSYQNGFQNRMGGRGRGQYLNYDNFRYRHDERKKEKPEAKLELSRIEALDAFKKAIPDTEDNLKKLEIREDAVKTLVKSRRRLRRKLSRSQSGYYSSDSSDSDDDLKMLVKLQKSELLKSTTTSTKPTENTNPSTDAVQSAIEKLNDNISQLVESSILGQPPPSCLETGVPMSKRHQRIGVPRPRSMEVHDTASASAASSSVDSMFKPGKVRYPVEECHMALKNDTVTDADVAFICEKIELCDRPASLMPLFMSMFSHSPATMNFARENVWSAAENKSKSLSRSRVASPVPRKKLPVKKMPAWPN